MGSLVQCGSPLALLGRCFPNNSITVLSGGCSNAVDVCDIKLLLRRLIFWWVVLRNQDFFNKAEFLCSSTSLMIWRLSSKPGHSSTTAAKPRRLPKTESPCSSDSALIFALSDVSRRLPALGRPLDLQVGVLGFTGSVPFPHPPPPQQFRKTHLCMRRRRY